MSDTKMLTGKVRWFDPKKGYGFITVNDASYFVHYKNILGKGFKTLSEGSTVNFKPQSGSKGMIATEVVPQVP